MPRFLLTLLLIFSLPSWALNLPGMNNNGFVPVDEAFMFNFSQQGERVYLEWQIKPGYYLYHHAFDVKGQQVDIAKTDLPPGIPYQDEFFGDVTIYRQSVILGVDLHSAGENSQLTVQYQGCADAGLCYPPETVNIPLRAIAGNPATTVDTTSSTSSVTSMPLTDFSSTPQSASPAMSNEQQTLASKLAGSRWTPALFLLLGIGLAFTPCVLPMYPILSGIVLGSGKRSHRQALGLAFVYVQGMALTYTLLGLVVASAGMQFQAAMQHPYVLGGLSLLFVVLALSMFGVYTLQMPASLQTKLNAMSNQQQGGRWVSVFTMGAISGLVCSPCTTAPLSGALLYVAQSGDLFVGAIALYALALGMGIPLILVAVFGNKLLPRSGPWMERVKVVFGFILLAVPVLLLERILPGHVTPYLWAVLGISFFGWIYHLKTSMPLGWKGTLVAIMAILGMFASVQPLYHQWFMPQASTEKTISFQYVANQAELDAALLTAKQQGKPVMLDFYADWCAACKEFEKYTFHAPQVESLLHDFVLIQADVTRNTPDDFVMLNQLDILGLPTIDFWDAAGQHRPDARVTGFLNAERFASHLQAAALTVTAK